MLIGILSETHGHVTRSRLAAERLVEAGVEAVVHCGDIGSEAVLVELAAVFSPLDIPVTAVLGNVDLYGADLTEFPSTTGIRVVGRKAEVEWEGQSGAILHGDDMRALEAAILSQQFDYLFTGHTHVAADERRGTTRVINPGAVYRSPEPSVATLNVETDELTLIPLER